MQVSQICERQHYFSKVSVFYHVLTGFTASELVSIKGTNTLIFSICTGIIPASLFTLQALSAQKEHYYSFYYMAALVVISSSAY